MIYIIVAWFLLVMINVTVFAQKAYSTVVLELLASTDYRFQRLASLDYGSHRGFVYMLLQKKSKVAAGSASAGVHSTTVKTCGPTSIPHLAMSPFAPITGMACFAALLGLTCLTILYTLLSLFGCSAEGEWVCVNASAEMSAFQLAQVLECTTP